MSKELEKLSLKEKWDNFLDFVDAPTKARLLDCDCKDGLEQYRYLRTEIEGTIKEKETQDSLIATIKGIIAFAKKLPDFEVKDNGDIQGVFGAVGMRIQRQMENQERELFRNWVLKECFPKELKVLAIIKKKGLSLLHQSLIISSKNYKEYRQEFQLVKSREFKNEYFYSQQEFDLVREVLL